MQFIMQCGLVIIMVDIFEAEMFARETDVELLDRSTLQHLIHIDMLMFTFVKYLALDERVAETSGQMLT